MESRTRPKPVVLAILDGWGITQPSPANPLSLAKLPNFQKFQDNYPVATLQASGESVGLSWGELGNSEVGHLSLGAGKIIYQSLPRINRSIADGSFFSNPAFMAACEQVKKQQSKLHLMGLLSSGGVHAYYEHLYALIELAKNQGVEQIYVHVFLDGRDMPFNSGLDQVAKLQRKLIQFGVGKIASLSGRFYAMDRDNHWERIEQVFKAMVQGVAERQGPDPIKLIEESYSQQNYDEEFIPTIITKEDGTPQAVVAENDAVIFFNFRADRARELTKAFVLPSFSKFSRPYLKNLFFVSLMEYE
ncbi:MAG: 2,3-bisphosphoglycerate-independent phosphoglycerate mutase, partial [Candidatus Komeilibacteria bacterium]|nr:2,3-bisphosphoglycerate-independent phosphoglycerate mutase [Candidatus Komeilibacteria bacterium]